MYKHPLNNQDAATAKSLTSEHTDMFTTFVQIPGRWMKTTAMKKKVTQANAFDFHASLLHFNPNR